MKSRSTTRTTTPNPCPGPFSRSAAGTPTIPRRSGAEDHPVWAEIQKEIISFQPDLVGLSVLTVKVPSALKIAALCRAVSPSITVVAGGEHATARPQDFLNDPNVDFVVRGEGETTLNELAAALQAGKSPLDIDGLSLLEAGRIRHNPDRALLENLDALPLPARHLLLRRESYRPLDFGLILGSRGCSFNCSFCTVHNIWKRKTRFRSAALVVEEIKTVMAEYATRYFSFRDYSFSMDAGWVREFCDLVDRKTPGIEWECTTRPDLIDDELLTAMKRAGCRIIRLGIESGSQRILDSVSKGTTVQKIEKAASLLHRHGMHWTGYFMFGLPSETEADVEQTLRLIDRIDPPFVTMARYTPLPGSELYNTLAANGGLADEYGWGEFSNQSLRVSLTRENGRKNQTDMLARVARYVDEHNRRNNSKRSRVLLKTD